MKPWQETWYVIAEDGILSVCKGQGSDFENLLYVEPALDGHNGHRANLAAAAPDMVRALLVVEWGGGSLDIRCPGCKGEQPPDTGHRSDCALDNALIKAGFPDQASRDAARKVII